MDDKVSEKMAKRIKNAGQWLIENADLIANKSKLCTNCYISFEVMCTDIVPSIDIDYSFVVPEDDKSKGMHELEVKESHKDDREKV